MELKHIDIAQLSVSTTNMRGKKKAPDLTNILPSVRARGVLVPLIVRRSSSPETYEIVAGKRRYHAALIVAQEQGSIDPLPCAVMDDDDDVAALEASLIENIARLDPDEVTSWETFTRLVKEGRSAEEISLTFGLTELQVKRTLALGNLLPRIRDLYRRGSLDTVTVRHLTLASKQKQREWLSLYKDGSARAPLGRQLKAWLLGGDAIGTSKALFDLDHYKGEIVADLFGAERYFGDVELFWELQTKAVEDRADSCRAAGWQDVVILPRGEVFQHWEHERCPKAQGGRVYVTISQSGEVSIHEGFITRKEARKLETGGTIDKPIRPELSAPLTSYVDLHRHAAVRAKIAMAPNVALRLMVAHAIANSLLWRVDVANQRGANEAITESVENSASEAMFDQQRRNMLAKLGLDPDTATITGHRYDRDLIAVYRQLLALEDGDVMNILAIVMGETLDPGSDLIELLGTQLAVDMADIWQADDTLLDLIRDREVMTHVLTDVAGNEVASGNIDASTKVRRQIVRDCLNGANGRDKRMGWVPRWMAFPPSAYTQRGGVSTVDRCAKVTPTVEVEATEPEPPDGDAGETVAEADADQ